MQAVNEHIKRVEKLTQEWLRPDNRLLQKMIEKTLSERLFSFSDIKFQIRALKQNIDAGQISRWADRAGISEMKNNFNKKILCLHAGNLPLVGFQDALGMILSGADYHGKLSRKDPYLLRSYLRYMEQAGLKNKIYYSTNLDDFEYIRAEKAFFAGAESSVEPVKNLALKIGAVTEKVQWVIRSAKFSMAWLPDDSPQSMQDLTEAVFRYGGQGCRSVAVVVSPMRLRDVQCELQDYIESFWLKNPQHKKPLPVLEYQFALNKAVGREQAWMQDFLIQETRDCPELDFCLNWVTGNTDTVKELAESFGGALQNIYTPGIKIEGLKTEFLSKAQTPDLWWPPDGLDVI